MIDNVRWLLAFLCVGATLWGIVILIGKGGTPASGGSPTKRDGGIAAFVGAVGAWAFAELPPFAPWPDPSSGGVLGRIGDAPQPRVLLACIAYLAVVAASSRGLIGMPQYRVLQSRAAELTGLARLASDHHRDLAPLTGSPREERGAAIYSYWTGRIVEAQKAGVFRFLGIVVSVPLPNVSRAGKTLNSIERQLLSELHGDGLRLEATSIAASLPVGSTGSARRTRLQQALDSSAAAKAGVGDQAVRDACIEALALVSRTRDEPRDVESERIRVAIWLTVVGLLAVYAVSVNFPRLNDPLIAGALGGMLGSLSVLVLRRADYSLGLIVLAPVAGALNAAGGLVLVSFLAQEEIQVLGEVFRNAWAEPGSTTALAVGLLLGFSGGLFSRLAIASTAPLLGGDEPAGQPPSRDGGETASGQAGRVGRGQGQEPPVDASTSNGPGTNGAPRDNPDLKVLVHLVPRWSRAKV